MRTQDEILERIRERKDEDMLGFEWHEYVAYLDFDHAKEFLKDTATAEDRNQADINGLRQVMIEYMPFAWDKANNCRGISAGRSLAHYVAWLWLAGDDELLGALDDYEFYGKDELVRICEHLGLDADTWDDGVRTNG
jgi:hypothetical protein